MNRRQAIKTLNQHNSVVTDKSLIRTENLQLIDLLQQCDEWLFADIFQTIATEVHILAKSCTFVNNVSFYVTRTHVVIGWQYLKRLVSNNEHFTSNLVCKSRDLRHKRAQNSHFEIKEAVDIVAGHFYSNLSLGYSKRTKVKRWTYFDVVVVLRTNDGVFSAVQFKVKNFFAKEILSISHQGSLDCLRIIEDVLIQALNFDPNERDKIFN